MQNKLKNKMMQINFNLAYIQNNYDFTGFSPCVFEM